MTTSGNNDRDEFREEVELKLPTLPPVIFGIPIVLGALIHVFIWSGDIIGGATGVVIGVVLITVGLGIIFWTFRVMRAHGEHPEPNRATKTLVTSGPFKRTRNPIYSGFLLIGAGMAISLNAMAMLVAVFFGVAALTALVIRREEAYLERKFGEVYLKYANKTGRWL
ncbi:MAG: isoprenylcysteine carboxylmethyltransferase family protein [Chloroflexi bacterium]|nr:isoprenylcysteine carboxylmethyltransferase family protein [Chloroflexota bacterium]